MAFKNAYPSISCVIGHTPLVLLRKTFHNFPQAEVWGKCEFLNPGGSIKDRLALYYLDSLEKNNQIRPGGIIVESTTGNTGFSLAYLCSMRGYRFIAVVPDKVSQEKQEMIRALGGEVVVTATNVPFDSPKAYYNVARKLADKLGGIYFGQYDNLINTLSHYHSTGKELWEETCSEDPHTQKYLDYPCAIVIGMGTCGTISGIGKFFKEKKAPTLIVGVDHEGSILKDVFEKQTLREPFPYLLEGIGEDFIPKNYDFSVIDAVISVGDREAFSMNVRVVQEEGIFCGGSSGAALAATEKLLEQRPGLKKIVVILPDSGNRYLSKVFNAQWRKENNFDF